jgi:hypothetical protein
MYSTIVRAGAVRTGASLRYGLGSISDQMMRLLVAPALQHCVYQDTQNTGYKNITHQCVMKYTKMLLMFHLWRSA